MSEFYHPECARGVRWNDPAFRLVWPLDGKIISEKDQHYSGFHSMKRVLITGRQDHRTQCLPLLLARV